MRLNGVAEAQREMRRITMKLPACCRAIKQRQLGLRLQQTLLSYRRNWNLLLVASNCKDGQQNAEHPNNQLIRSLP
jgi:hypothetical protein